MKRWILIGTGTLLVVAVIAVYAVIGIQEDRAKQAALAATPVVGVSQVEIQNYLFVPARIEVAPGTTVTWTNDDDAPHSITFDDGMKDSGLFRLGGKFSYTFTTPGTYSYHCSEHPYMVGAVIVTG